MDSTKKVAVLLCTYNGEKYIREQIDSILHQTYSNISLYIQDDCSSDSTPQILNEYRSYPQVTIYNSTDNLGYPFSFYDLLKKVTDADYYAFSDQDDVWYEDKIERAVRLLDKSDPLKPAMTFANYDVCDEDLNYIRSSRGPSRHPDFLYSLYSCLGLGFTCVFNKTGKLLIQNRRSVRNITKDVWTGMCCTAFGEAYFDSKPCALHRRNPGSFSSQDKNFIQIQKDRFDKFVRNNGLNNVYSVIEEFYEIFNTELPDTPKRQLEFFLYRGNNPIHRLRKVFYPKRLRYDMPDEIMLRILFLLGIL